MFERGGRIVSGGKGGGIGGGEPGENQNQSDADGDRGVGDIEDRVAE